MTTRFFIKNGDDYEPVENLTEEQIADFCGDAGWLKGRLEREREKVTKQYADYDDLKAAAEKAEADKTDYDSKIDELQKKLDEANAATQKAALETDRVKIIHEFGLNDEMAEFVTGDTVDEMRGRAEKLAHNITAKVNVNKSEKPEQTDDNAAKKMAKDLFGEKSD